MTTQPDAQTSARALRAKRGAGIGQIRLRLRQRLTLTFVFLAVVTMFSGAVWRASFVQGLEQLAARGAADLALAGDRLVGQLQRYRDLSVFLADHPDIVASLTEGATAKHQSLLLKKADSTAALDVLVIKPDGTLVASALGRDPGHLMELQYVKRALRGALGWGHGTAAPLSERVFFHAAPVFGANGKVLGALAVVTDLNGIDYNWRGSNPAAFFTDRDGVVFISNRSELLFWQRKDGSDGLAPPDGAVPPFAERTLGRHEIWNLNWGPYLPQEALHLTQELPVIGMTGEVLLDLTQTKRLAWAQAAAVAALCLAFGSMLFLAAERRRALAEVNARLEERVEKRTTALRESNLKLVAEAAEREEAQAALRQAQDDLVQAGKLSALGQMSAGISHELNQPLMAIRSFSENAATFLERGKPEKTIENLGRISDMARRMGRIIQNLRAFARQDSAAQESVNLNAILETALELTRASVTEADVTVVYHPPERDVLVRGGEVRLSQVFVNLITNATDAMADCDQRRLVIQVEDLGPVIVHFRDTGPGIEMPDKVFDPFYTTKSVGEVSGMGLGLSISYGIVQSFGGQIKGDNGPEGGAHFSVTLERADIGDADR